MRDPGPTSAPWSAPGRVGRKRGEDDDAVARWLKEGARLSACPDAAACGA